MSAELGMVAAARATEVNSAIEALDFETEPLSKVTSARLGRVGAQMTPFAGCSERSGSNVLSGKI
jgi:hypothetical protein